MEDPFLVVKGQVETQLSNAHNLFESWKRIQQTVSSPQNQELLWTAEELNAAIEGIDQDLDDLDEALQAASQNPSQFHLTAQDLNQRGKFIKQSRSFTRNIRHTLANPPSKKKTNNPYDSSYESSSGSSKPYQTAQNDNSIFIENQQQQQSMIMQEQDQHLDAMGGTIVNLREIAGTMHKELDDQVIILDELHDQVDHSEGRLKQAMRRVTTILKQEEESKSGYCICCLIIILIILLILVMII
ncbi:syntaxin 6, N-terminal-domain-containing protein [Mycotypha africana]|uniref:syntaxin 6, N-terminal-domain-containing protein n=1 Tax=Mycotypha africana TaxID=64632 RepID=UPI0022FFED99|nr:syntaxin 6, N-terminal-domain-containing protein [Mycotypha africana]KAI8983932.1 syntaxin 6, N-terminal-domain-containing protein [Mycotypha africana]